MDCTTARTAASARMDGEPADAATDRQLDEHLRTCAACRAWVEQAADVTRRLRLQPVPAAGEDDLAARVVAGSRQTAVSPWPPERWLLVVVGATMLVLGGALLLAPGGGDGHLLREAAVTDIALGVGVLFAAVQPWRAAGMLPVVVALAVGLTVAGVADVASGRVTVAEESVHLLAPTAAFLLWRLRRRGPFPASPGRVALTAVADDERRRSA